MHAWICNEPTGVEALQWTARPAPEPAAGEVRLAVRAASLNYPDLLVVQGKYQMRPEPPFVPGAEFSGVVEAVGAGVTRFKAGDRVMAFAGTGGFATHACLAERLLLPMPAGFSFEDAAAFVMTYGTSHHALVDRAQLRANETVLVLGAAGGVGTAALQVAKAAGARVIAGVSSAEKAALCASLGADAVIDYGHENLREALKALTGGKGPDVVYDPVGGDLAEPALRSIAWRGRYLVIGFTQGVPALPWNLPLLKGASIVGVFFGEFSRREPAAAAATLAELARWHAAGSIKPVLDRVLPMARLPEAFARLAGRQALGKLVMIND